MESISVLKLVNFINVNPGGNNFTRGKSFSEKISIITSIFKLLAKGGVNFFRYLKNLGLSGEPDLVILSSRNHYQYDKNDLKSGSTLISLKKLNLIKYLDAFLYALIRILPQNTNFIGCFSDGKTKKVNAFSFYHPFRLLNRFFNSLDTSKNHNMDKNEISEVLERNGFKIVDMTEMNGLTFFYSQKISGQIELSS